MTEQLKSVVVLISGNGSNLQALIDHASNYKIALVVSNRSNAFGLERASKSNIPTLVSLLSSFKHSFGPDYRQRYDLNLAEQIKSKLGSEPDLIVLGGFMHILSQEFISNFTCPIINLHPALPGQFDGINAIERAYEKFLKGEIEHTGIMVHHVIPQVDAGNVILQQVIEMKENDTLDLLKERIHGCEHQLLVKAVNLLLQ